MPKPVNKQQPVLSPDADLMPGMNIKLPRNRRPSAETDPAAAVPATAESESVANPITDIAKKAAAVGALGLAGAAVAKGLSSLTGKPPVDDTFDPLTMVPEPGEAAEEDSCWFAHRDARTR